MIAYDKTLAQTAISACNESRTMRNIVARAAPHIDDVNVDDGSTDDTAAQELTAGMIAVQHETNHGYDEVLNTALAEAKRRTADHLVIFDTDSQYDLMDISRLFSSLLSTDVDIAIDRRFRSESENAVPLYRLLGFLEAGFGYCMFSNYPSFETFSIGLVIRSVFFIFLGILSCFILIVLHSLDTYLVRPKYEREPLDRGEIE